MSNKIGIYLKCIDSVLSIWQTCLVKQNILIENPEQIIVVLRKAFYNYCN